MSDGFTSEEKGVLARLLAAGEESPPCPRCGTPLERRNVPPRPEVSYVRHRIWLLCAGCGAEGVLERRSVDRESRE